MENHEIKEKSFKEFIQKQGVVGLAVGFILGGATSTLITAFVNDIINPIVGFFMGSAQGLASASLKIGPVQIMWGHFVTTFLNFLILALVVYYGIKVLRKIKLPKKSAERKVEPQEDHS